jgi:hypothetical protein
MSEQQVPSWIVSIVAGARNPHNWLASAEELKRGSDLLRATWMEEAQSMHQRFQAYMAGEFDRPWEPWVGGPAMTLAAFALENALKGLMIAERPELVQPSVEQPEILFDPQVRTHDLVQLATRAGVQLSSEERTLLARLSEFAEWAGRYRFPVRAGDAAPRPGAEAGGSSFTSDWFPTLDELFERLRGDLFAAGSRIDRERGAAAAAQSDQQPD